jgi:hypothetical protein
MMISASNERMPVSAGSAGLRIEAVVAGVPAFLGLDCNLSAGPLEERALSSKTCIIQSVPTPSE